MTTREAPGDGDLRTPVEPEGSGAPPGGRGGRRLGARISSGLGRNFWLLWGGWSVSSVGNGLTVTALPLLAADLTSDPATLSLVGMADKLPWLLLALMGGALADRWDRRRAMWVSDAVRCAILVVLFVAVLGGWASIPLLMVIAFSITSIETVYDSSRSAILPMAVSQDREALERANSRLMTANTVALKFLGPALGGVLYTVGRAVPVGVDAISFAVSSVFSFLMRGDFRADGAQAATVPGARPRRAMRKEIGEGVRWLARHRVLRVFTLVAGLTNMCTVGQLAMLVLYARQVMEISDMAYGLLLASVAVGSVTAGFTCRMFTHRLGPARSALGGVMLGALGFTILGFTSEVAFVALGLAVTGYTAMTWNVTTVSIRQAIVPKELTGRVSSVNRLVAFGLMPVGILLAGQIATHVSLEAVYRVGGLFGAAVSLIGLLTLSNAAVERALHEAGAR
ncbi:MFS transporter [Streptosporangium sp. OZ121]|uniref:MFS transporter n=1 Tax=Streptosporangium sp. OZ121 TaxID=3444183 RepID=UPI003F79AE5B